FCPAAVGPRSRDKSMPWRPDGCHDQLALASRTVTWRNLRGPRWHSRSLRDSHAPLSGCITIVRLLSYCIMRLRFRLFGKPFLIALALACNGPQLAMAENTAGVAFLEKLSLAPATTPVLTLCHGFGCAYRNQFVITPARLSFIRTTLAGARSAK